MKFDIILEPDSPDRFTELALLAESYGFGAIWTANHLAARDPFMCFMEAAKATSRIRLGPVAVSPFELHPVKMANQLFTLNEASGGRANIVVGGGGGSVIGMGLKPGRRTMIPRMVRSVEECVEFLRAGLSPDTPVNFEGEVFQIHGYQPFWANDAPPVIYVAASKDQMLKMAVRVADGVMLSDTPLQRIDDTIATLRDALATTDRSEADYRISNLYSWHLKDDRAEAMREARAKLWIRGMLDPHYLSTFLDEADCKFVEDHFDAFGKAYLQNSPDIEGVPDRLVDELVEHLTFTGTIDQVDQQIDKLKAFEEKGVNEFGIRLYDRPEDSIRLLGERVMPAFS